MNKSSYFVEGRALFGSYPSQDDVNWFEQQGVRYFVNLTGDGEENCVKYVTHYQYINYPISDFSIPMNWSSFAKFIVRLTNIIKNLEPETKMYVHCRGGHGRAGVVVASILCHLHGISAVEALVRTSQYHDERPEMRERWRKIGSPQTNTQKNFVIKFFEPMPFAQVFVKEYMSGFGLWAPYTVTIENTEFKSAGDAILSLGEDKAYEIIKAKFGQHIGIRANLMNTGLRPLIYADEDLKWGCLNGEGENRLGKIMYRVREELYEKLNQGVKNSLI